MYNIGARAVYIAETCVFAMQKHIIEIKALIKDMKISMTDGDLVGNSKNFVAYAKVSEGWRRRRAPRRRGGADAGACR